MRNATASIVLITVILAPALAGCTAVPSPSLTASGKAPALERPLQPSTTRSQRLLYVTQNVRETSVSSFAPNSSGTVMPVTTIQGVDTKLSHPYDVATDSKGEIIVADSNENGLHPDVKVFPAGANGDVAPIANIHGPATGLGIPSALVIDSQDRIYVANRNGTPTPNVVVFSPGSHGDASPIYAITGSRDGLQNPTALALDVKDDLYVADNAKVTISEFAPRSNGDVAPIAVIGGSLTKLVDPVGVAVDRNGTIFVSNVHVIEVYAPGSNGNVAPIAEFSGPNSRLGVSDISVRGLNVFVAGQTFVDVFPSSSNGQVNPREFTSPTLLPYGIGF
jgi:hypothetical protein